MQSLLINSLLVGASALNIPDAALSRRAAVNAGAALAGLAPFAATAKEVPKKEAELVKSTAASLKVVIENKDSFITDLSNGVEGAGKLPAPIPFTTFQKLEATAEPEFMEAAIDYAEGARDGRLRAAAAAACRACTCACPSLAVVPLRLLPSRVGRALLTDSPLADGICLPLAVSAPCSVPRRQGPCQARKARKVDGGGDDQGGWQAQGRQPDELRGCTGLGSLLG